MDHTSDNVYEEGGNCIASYQSKSMTNPAYASVLVPSHTTSMRQHEPHMNRLVKARSYEDVPPDGNVLTKAGSYDSNPQVNPQARSSSYDNICPHTPAHSSAQTMAVSYGDVCPGHHIDTVPQLTNPVSDDSRFESSRCANELVKAHSYEDVQPADPSSHMNVLGKADSYDDILPSDQMVEIPNPRQQCDPGSASQYEILYDAEACKVRVADHARDSLQKQEQPQ